MSASVEYLGHRIDPDGIHAMDSKLEAIHEAPTPPPHNIQELHSFLGLLNYYASFIPNLSSLINHLNRLLHHDTRWKWSKDCEVAFNAAKARLLSSNLLVHYLLGWPEMPLLMVLEQSSLMQCQMVQNN